MVEFRMPSLGADMEAGTLVEWLVKPGDRIKRGDIIAVVETQKGAIEIEVFDSGVIEEILIGINGRVPVGTPLARIRTEMGAEAAVVKQGPPSAEPVSPRGAASPEPAVSPPVVPPPGPQSTPPAAAGGAPRVRISPAARRLARMHGIDVAAIAGSGPAGAILRADVERRLAAPAAPVGKKRALGIDVNAMRAAIAATMARSKREIPHYYLEHQVDVTESEQWLAHTNANRLPSNRLLLGVLAIKSVALAARRFPAFNGFCLEGRHKSSEDVHVGVAIAIRGGGLAAPALHDVDRLTPDELMVRLRDLVQRVRAGRIRSSEVADATITVSSLGERGVEALYGVIYPPQVALVGFGKATQRPWVVEGTIAARSVVTVTLAADHRVSDGHSGALFLAEIGRLLQEPEKL
jgi:pyruvate dehydrogenase E2 component (dihydrolipoamide acetyltransferase)